MLLIPIQWPDGLSLFFQTIAWIGAAGINVHFHPLECFGSTWTLFYSLLLGIGISLAMVVIGFLIAKLKLKVQLRLKLRPALAQSLAVVIPLAYPTLNRFALQILRSESSDDHLLTADWRTQQLGPVHVAGLVVSSILILASVAIPTVTLFRPQKLFEWPMYKKEQVGFVAFTVVYQLALLGLLVLIRNSQVQSLLALSFALIFTILLFIRRPYALPSKKYEWSIRCASHGSPPLQSELDLPGPLGVLIVFIFGMSVANAWRFGPAGFGIFGAFLLIVLPFILSCFGSRGPNNSTSPSGPSSPPKPPIHLNSDLGPPSPSSPPKPPIHLNSDLSPDPNSKSDHQNPNPPQGGARSHQ